MKLCLNCNARFPSSLRSCPGCCLSPIDIDGFDAYAPEFAYDGPGFKASYFSELARLEAENFWFQSRNKLIMWAVKKYYPQFNSFLEIGCGTGYVLTGVAKKFPGSKLFGSEIFIAGLNFAVSRLPSAVFMQLDARRIPFENEFDVIGAFDVIEHIKEDEKVLSQMYAALKPGGVMLLTVPQHAWLWSPIDEYACHQRRYSASELHNKIEFAGFRILRSTSFVSTLLPAMFLSRFFQKQMSDENFDASSELQISPWLNNIFSFFLGIELFLIKRGINFPIGGSRLIIAKKI